MTDARWRKNEAGACPGSLKAKGSKVFVRLRNGLQPPEAWDATAMRWTLTQGRSSDFDVIAYRAEKD